MRVAIISQYFDPEPVRIPRVVADGLAARGHRVRVVTGFPNYPGGHLYDGYRLRWREYDLIGDIPVRRVPLWPGHSPSTLSRVVNYASFALGTLTARRFIWHADVIYVYATQMTAAIAPDAWRRFGGPPFVLHVQDLWPESVTGSSFIRSGAVARGVDRLLPRWLRGVYQRASGVIAIAPTMARMLIERGASPEQTTTVLNWAVDEAAASSADAVRETDAITVMYAGNLGDLQGLDTAVRAARLVAADTPRLRLVLVGAGVAEARLRDAAEGLENVEFRPRVPIDQMPKLYAESDFQLIILRDLKIFRGTIPSKFQGSLAAGVPVITSIAGDVAALVQEHGLGFAAQPGDVESLAAAFRAAARSTAEQREGMSHRARATYTTMMSMERALDRIEDVLLRAAQTRGHS